jgi:hypothetical protein
VLFGVTGGRHDSSSKQASKQAITPSPLLDVKCKANQKAPNHTPPGAAARGPERDQSTGRTWLLIFVSLPRPAVLLRYRGCTSHGRQTHDTGGKPWIPCARLLPPPVNLSHPPNCVRFHMLPILAREATLDLLTKPLRLSSAMLRFLKTLMGLAVILLLAISRTYQRGSQ